MIKHMQLAFDNRAKRIKDQSGLTWQQILDLGLEVVEKSLEKKKEKS